MPDSPEPAPRTKPEVPGKEQSVGAGPRTRWQRYVTPVLVVLLALAVFVSLVRNWNFWEGDKAEQVTDDAYVRGDLTPLSTKVTGIVSAVHVADYQQVKKGDLLLELQDSDFQAQVRQADAGVAAARAAIENNRRQKQLQQAKIDRALAGVSQAQAETSERRRELRPRRRTWTALFPNAIARRLSSRPTPQLPKKLSKWWPPKKAHTHN